MNSVRLSVSRKETFLVIFLTLMAMLLPLTVMVVSQPADLQSYASITSTNQPQLDE